MEYNKKIFLCEDSIEGIFTSVYDGWKWGAAGNQYGMKFTDFMAFSDFPRWEAEFFMQESLRRMISWQCLPIILRIGCQTKTGLYMMRTEIRPLFMKRERNV